MWMLCAVCIVFVLGIVAYNWGGMVSEGFGGGHGGGGGRGGGMGRGGRVGGIGHGHVGGYGRGGGYGWRGRGRYYGGYYGGYGGGGGGGYYGWLPFWYWLYPQDEYVAVPPPTYPYYPSYLYSYPYNSNQII